MHQRKSNPIKWKLYVNKANLNLSWILLSSTPAGAIFSEWLRGEYMIITSSCTCQVVNAPGLAILSTLLVQLMDIDLHFKRNVCLAWFKHTGARRCSSVLYLIISCHAATDFLSSLTWQPWNGSFLFWTTNLRVLAEANGDTAIQTNQAYFTHVSGFWLLTFYLRLSTRPCHEWLG